MGVGVRVGGGGHDRCEQRSGVFVKIQKKNWGGGGGSGSGGQDGCEQRIEVFVKMQKNGGGEGSGGGEGRVGGVRVYVNEELKFL